MKIRSSRTRWLLALAAIGLCGLAVLFVFLRPEIDHFRRWLAATRLRDIRACLCRPDKDVRLMREDDLMVAGSVYGVERGGRRPGILLIHGNTPMGRRLPLYRVLAKQLADRGYVVLTIDRSGVGESDDPFVSREAVENREADVMAALDYLVTIPSVAVESIFIIGHSGGAGPAFQLGISDPRVKGIVAIGPPRRGPQRLADPQDREYFWNRALRDRMLLYGKPFPDWYTRDMWIERSRERDMQRYLPYFSTAGHKPLLLLDGERESNEDRAYLREYFDELSPPAQYQTIAAADHYSNVTGFLGWPPALVVYDGPVVGRTVDYIDRWLQLASK